MKKLFAIFALLFSLSIASSYAKFSEKRGYVPDPPRFSKIEGKWYSHQLSFNLYGLDKNLDNIRKNEVVFVAEAEKSVLQAESFIRPNCTVAVCGSNFNKYQLHLLLKYCDFTLKSNYLID